jgi:endonuclease-3
MSATTTETLEARRERASLLLARLRQEYPDARCSLNFSNPLELLVATILSAQCTDERVNQVTESLFQKYRTAEDYARAPLEELEQDIRQTGFYRNKAKHIRETAALLVAEHGGTVPADMAALLTLPGVARKTANVVLGNAFGVIEGVVVDTHVGRLARRMGFTQSEDPAKIEQDLMALFPPADWLDLSHILIYHGRSVCQARKPLCNLCAVANLCPTGAEILGIALDLSDGMESTARGDHTTSE